MIHVPGWGKEKKYGTLSDFQPYFYTEFCSLNEAHMCLSTKPKLQDKGLERTIHESKYAIKFSEVDRSFDKAKMMTWC